MLIEPIPSTSVDQDGRGYPRPLLRRESWLSLNGTWDFAFDLDAAWRHPAEVTSWGERIRVPFAPVATASLLGLTGFIRA
jgi:hypothetical protein